MTYEFLQQYWWFVVSLLGGLLVFLLFVQGGNSLLLNLPENETQRQMMINSTGRKWEFTFTTLVTFGGAFFASFPLFYSTSFGGAYWVWMLILFTFVVQAVSYEFQSKLGNLLGKNTYRGFLIVNGVLAPILLGAAVSTFFTGSNFYVDKGNITDTVAPVISYWGNASGGLDACLNIFNVVLGLAVLFLSRILGELYFINNIEDDDLHRRAQKSLGFDTIFFLAFFLTWFVYLLIKEGFVVDPATGVVSMETFKYLHNLMALPLVTIMLLVGVVLVIYGIFWTLVKSTFRRGIWLVGTGTVLTVTALLLLAGYNNTAYYPSVADLQSSLTLVNSCSSEFTLTTMFYVSLLVPFVLAYIFYAWRKIDSKPIDADEMQHDEHTY
jgi:cytochrome d ubiquinol oxidase subunit II